MKASSLRGTVGLFTLGVFLAGCPASSCNSESETSDVVEDDGGSAAPSSNSTSTPAGSGSAKAPEKEKPSVVALAKAELDGKKPAADLEGATLAVASAKVDFIVPKEWEKSSDDDLEKAVGDEARFAASGEGKDVVAALALAECTWGEDEDISLGADALGAKVADGVCMRGKTVVRTIRGVIANGSAEVVAVGAWDDGSKNDDVLEAFRSAAKMRSVAACCSALTSNAAIAPANQKLIYVAAAGVCQALVNTKEGRQALAQIRGKLPGVSIPAACR